MTKVAGSLDQQQDEQYENYLRLRRELSSKRSGAGIVYPKDPVRVVPENIPDIRQRGR